MNIIGIPSRGLHPQGRRAARPAGRPAARRRQQGRSRGSTDDLSGDDQPRCSRTRRPDFALVYRRSH